MIRWTLIVFSLAVLLAACSADEAEKLGADGERCLVDVDCRDGLFCHSGLCTDAAGNNGVNNGANNGANNGFVNNGVSNNGVANNGFPGNNGPVNNGFPGNNGTEPPDPGPEPEPEIEAACRDFCDHIEGCGFGFEGECQGICVDAFERDLDTLYCALDASCRELERGACFDGEPEPACGDGICDRGENARNCPSDCGEEPDEIEQCFDVCFEFTSCEELVEACGQGIADEMLDLCLNACEDPGFREQLRAVANLPCSSVVPLAIEGFGYEDECR